jgi:hypothetical protein
MLTTQLHEQNLLNDPTKQICFLCFISIFLIMLFVISPLSGFYKTSLFIKLIVIILLSYTFYLIILQTNQMRKSYNNSKELQLELTTQLNMNIICSYVFLLFIGLLIIFVIKTF